MVNAGNGRQATQHGRWPRHEPPPHVDEANPLMSCPPSEAAAGGEPGYPVNTNHPHDRSLVAFQQLERKRRFQIENFTVCLRGRCFT